MLQPAFAEAANGNCFLAGQKFTTTTSLTLDNVFVFEAAGNNTFYLKRQGLNENQYLADPSNQNFYTSATDRAWKFEVKQITETRDPEHSYEWTHAKADGTDTTETIKGLRAYVEEAKASNSPLDLSTFTFVQADNAIVLVSTESKKKRPIRTASTTSSSPAPRLRSTAMPVRVRTTTATLGWCMPSTSSRLRKTSKL